MTHDIDLDALTALLKAADLTLPLGLSKEVDLRDGITTGLLAHGSGIEARIYVEETADLIVALLNAAPALLSALTAKTAELDQLKAKGSPGVMHEVDRAFYDLTIKERDAAKVRASNYAHQRDEARQERDAARAELERTRAQLTAQPAYVRVVVVVDWVRQRVHTITTDDAYAQQATRELAAKYDGNPNAATMWAWAVDVPAAAPQPDEPSVREVTLAEAAQQARLNLIEAERARTTDLDFFRETDSTCACHEDGRCGTGKAAGAGDGEQAAQMAVLHAAYDAVGMTHTGPTQGDGEQDTATCGAQWTTVVYPIKQKTTVVCTAHDGKTHVNKLTGMSWTDDEIGAVPAAADNAAGGAA